MWKCGMSVWECGSGNIGVVGMECGDMRSKEGRKREEHKARVFRLPRMEWEK
jgi:hypothetical protein